jgi:hypothetical protein
LVPPFQELWGYKMLKAEYEAKINIVGKSIACAVLDDGTRVLTQAAVLRAFGRPKKGKEKSGTRVTDMPVFLDSNNLQPFISNELREVTNSVEYMSKNGKNILKGYKAEILPMMCDVYLEARRKGGVLTKSQEPLAIAAEILSQGLSRLGITALIDEATGYQYVRDKLALEKILEAYVNKELMKWQKRFPDEWYENLFRIRGVEWKNGSDSRPQYIGKITNDIIYDRLPKGVLSELKKKNPPDEETGRRKHKHHQFLTPNIGHPKLQEIITGTTTLMKISPNWRKFYSLLQRAFPKHGEQTAIDFDSE